jgi:hypothetical protein
MKSHENQSRHLEAPQTACAFCAREFASISNRKRHDASCRQRPVTNLANGAQRDGTTQNVAQIPPLVAQIPPLVAEIPPLVAQIPPLVARIPPLVAQAAEDDEIACGLCYKTFSSKWNLQRHLERCNGLGDAFMCAKCRRVFKDKFAKYRHSKNCDGTGNEQALVAPEASSSRPLVPQTPNTSANSQHVQGNGCTLNQLNNQFHITYNINSFGKEDVSKILTPEFLDERLKEFNGKGIFQMVKDVHFNPDFPENQNIRMGSKKSKTLRVKENDGWHIRANCDIMEVLMTKYKSILSQRSFHPDFKGKLKHESDFMQIQQDLIKFDRRSNPTAYYSCAHKILALIEDLEKESAELKTDSD